MEKLKKCLIRYSILFSEAIGFFVSIILTIGEGSFAAEDILFMVAGSLIIGTFLIYPVALTVLNIFFLFRRTDDMAFIRKGKLLEYITVILGSLYSGLVLSFYEIQFQSDWTEILSNQQVHTPIWTSTYNTVFLISGIGLAGYLILSGVKLNRMPPLVIVCAMAAMYLGIVQCALWIVQIFSVRYLILCLFPFNCIVIAAKTIRYKIIEWNAGEQNTKKVFKNRFLHKINQKLIKSANWPIAAFLFMWPLLGVLICILVLIGQQPDSIIKAWTETSDWNLSNRVAPQNIYYDEHYLCTVAAGGHENVVKPIRLGMRHGHQVIVNRQLCVANAFEQILEERLPVFHKYLRHFYDKYGFPVARMIHSPYIADLVYFIMKPLEWMFLIVLYFSDVHPENRIALQYMPAEWK